jgi:hypothetical protein
MAAAASAALIAELDGAVRDGSPERRVQILRQVTDLFLSDADRLNETQISVFDDVLVRLIERVEARTLAHLSVTLSEIDTAPRAATRQLAFHDDALVAVPVLTKSNRLSEKDLIEIANTRGQQHLLAISGRETTSDRCLLNERFWRAALHLRVRCRGDQMAERAAIESVVRSTLAVEWGAVAPLKVDPASTPITAELAPALGGAADLSKVTAIDLAKLPEGFRLRRLIFQATRKGFAALRNRFKGNGDYLVFQLIQLIESFLASDRLNIPSLFHPDPLVDAT